MAAMSDFLEAQLLNLLFRTQVAWKPAAIHVALFTAAPNDAGGGTEVSGGSYARAQVTQADAQWNAPTTGGLIDNVNAIVFPTPSANWGTVTHIGIFDASTAGNLLLHGALTTGKTINNGDPAPQFNAGDLDITFA